MQHQMAETSLELSSAERVLVTLGQQDNPPPFVHLYSQLYYIYMATGKADVHGGEPGSSQDRCRSLPRQLRWDTSVWAAASRKEPNSRSTTVRILWNAYKYPRTRIWVYSSEYEHEKGSKSDTLQG